MCVCVCVCTHWLPVFFRDSVSLTSKFENPDTLDRRRLGAKERREEREKGGGREGQGKEGEGRERS